MQLRLREKTHTGDDGGPGDARCKAVLVWCVFFWQLSEQVAPRKYHSAQVDIGWPGTGTVLWTVQGRAPPLGLATTAWMAGNRTFRRRHPRLCAVTLAGCKPGGGAAGAIETAAIASTLRFYESLYSSTRTISSGFPADKVHKEGENSLTEPNPLSEPYAKRGLLASGQLCLARAHPENYESQGSPF